MSKFNLTMGLEIEKQSWVEPVFDIHASYAGWKFDFGNSRDGMSQFEITSTKLVNTNPRVIGIRERLNMFVSQVENGCWERPLRLSIPTGEILTIRDVYIEEHFNRHTGHTANMIRLRYSDDDKGHSAMSLIGELSTFPNDSSIKPKSHMRNKLTVAGVGIHDGCITLVAGIYVPKDLQIKDGLVVA